MTAKLKNKTTASKAATRTKRNKGKNLVVVESPAKARTIEKILGAGFVVKASQGHVRDLPKGRLGVDIQQGFIPAYNVLKEKRAVVGDLKKAGQNASTIYLATDPDREGEAISWHLIEAADWGKNETDLQRVVFHEITKEAVKEAFENPRSINMELVNAQQARRVLDRLVGYHISPLLWRKVQRGLSAGRVQSVALRLIVDREKEIGAFVSQEYWRIDAHLQKSIAAKREEGTFVATLKSIKGQKKNLQIDDEQAARAIESELQDATYTVAEVTKRKAKQSPSAPFITSTLQQEASRKLRFSAKRTMVAAQQLYEGITLGDEGSIGLITYMRTDSTHVAPAAVREAREYIQKKFGNEYLPNQPRLFKKKVKGAQEAHEAIRPTSIFRDPKALKTYLAPDQYRLYDLIWRRALASQIADSLADATTVDVDAKCKRSDNIYIFKATGSVLRFPGFRVLYIADKDEGDEEESVGVLPELEKSEKLDCTRLDPKQHYTQPPPRYTEASLISMLEQKGIGRPSTYAPIISTILDRNYVLKEAGKLKPTQLGSTVCELLKDFFPTIMDIDFTADMEEELDEVARGEREWVPMLSDFYEPFQKSLEVATETMPKVRVEEATDEICEKCGSPMVIKTGRFGRFLACSNFPECKNTKRILNKIGVQCPKCGRELVMRKPRGKGKVFYGCSGYPECDFLVNQRPVAEPCPECGGLMVASGKNGRAQCTRCAWKGDIPAEELAGVNG